MGGGLDHTFIFRVVDVTFPFTHSKGVRLKANLNFPRHFFQILKNRTDFDLDNSPNFVDLKRKSKSKGGRKRE